MDRPTICVAVTMEPELLARLEAAGEVRHVDPARAATELITAVGDAHGIVMSPMIPVGAAFLDAAPSLRVIAGNGVGHDNFDVALATERGVAICNTPGVLNTAVVDLTMAAIVGLARRMFTHAAFVRSGAWGRGEPRPPLGHDIAGKTLGVIGFGRIGQALTQRMQLLGMRTIWHDVFEVAPNGSPQSEYRSLDDLLREAHFVSVHTDLNAGSRHLIGERELGLMRDDAYLLNTARGAAVDQSALRSALEAGAIAGAALDVLEDEPPDPDEPLVRLPNVVVFPHIASATEETRAAMRELAVSNLLAVLAGETPPAIVNPEVLR